MKAMAASENRLQCLAGDQGNSSSQEERPLLQRDQCAYCEEMGHWAWICPNKEGRKKLPPQVLTTKDEEESY